MTTSSSSAAGLPDHLYLLDSGWIFTSAGPSHAMTARYNAALVLTSDRSPLRVNVDNTSTYHQALAVRPGVGRRVFCEGGRFVCVRLNPLHPLFRRFCAIEGVGVVSLDRDMLSEFDSELDAAFTGQLTLSQGMNCLAGLVATAAQNLPLGKLADARMDRALHILSANRSCNVGELSVQLGMSTSRLSHLFRDSIGVPIKTYLRWQRLRAAILEVTSGRSLTEIAHIAGYTDLSHFGREFREIAGVSPSYIFQSDRVRVFNWQHDSSSSNTQALCLPSDDDISALRGAAWRCATITTRNARTAHTRELS